MSTVPSTATDVLVPAHVACLTPWVEAGILGAAEVHMAAWLSRASGVQEPEVLLGAAMAVWAATHGHTCADLAGVAGIAVREALRTALSGDDRVADVDTEFHEPGETELRLAALEWPTLASWRAALSAAPLAVRTVESPDSELVLSSEPLVLCGDRLYLQRHWADECIIAADLRRRAAADDDVLSDGAIELLDLVLPSLERNGDTNLQRVAAETVLTRRVSLVVGGPGTGKTYSVARVLAALTFQAQQQGVHLRIALAAPTGKAATRLGESIATALRDDSMSKHVPESVRKELGTVTATTVHRLLGPQGAGSQRFRHDAANPLPHDVVLIDECSMVSLPLLARLCEAVRPEARLVLIGDPDQLESVELGAVLGDLVASSGTGTSPATTAPLAGHVVRLQRAHRFEEDSPIALLADAVRDGAPPSVVARLQAAGAGAPGSPVRFVEIDDPRGAASVSAIRGVVQPALERVRVAAQSGDAEAAIDALSGVRMLCAHRRGPFGVGHWNRVAERWMCGDGGAGTAWFSGRPVLITRNDPRLGLSNGDTGVVVAGADGPSVAFRTSAGVVMFDPVQLESVETAFAMTVHKSQGSEFPVVVLVLPPHDSPLVGRELLYTAVTRAKREVLVVGSADAVTACVATPARRMTGLASALA